VGENESVVRSLARALGLATSIGVPFAVLVSCGALAGTFLDRHWGVSPWLTVTGVVLGAVGAFANLVRVASLAGRSRGGDDDADSAPRPSVS
jgi:F0F1-type ATP synthase assembly protein I